MGYSNWFQVVLHKWYGFNQLVCVGMDAEQYRFDLHKQYLPNKLALVVIEKSEIPLLVDKEIANGTKFYRCVDKSCGLPTNSIHSFWEQINNA